MKIGIDASRTFVENPTGTEKYAWEVTSRLLLLSEAKKHEWVLYTRNVQYSKFNVQLIGQIKKRLNVKICEIPMSYLWTQAGLAYRTWVDGLDVLWVPAHTLPVLRPSGQALKTVVTIHGLEYEWLPAYENPLQRWYLPLSTIYACKSATKVIAVSKFTGQQIVERIGVDSKKIKVIYEGYTRQITNSGSQLKKYGLKPKQYLLFVGTIQPRKNLVRLVEAFSRLKTSLKLVIAGQWGWMYDEIKAAPGKYGVEDQVIFTGYVSETEKSVLLAEALMYIQPSITEGFGLPVLEAMGSGTPVVSSRGGALDEIMRIRNSKNYAGLLFDPFDTGDMSRKIKKVMGDETLRSEMVSRGRTRVKDFSWNKAAVETYNILTETGKPRGG